MTRPLMTKATAVWLVDNTTLSFRQIADFCGMHELEVQGIADGDVAVGVKGFDPVASSQLDAIEITRGEADPAHVLKLKFNAAAVGEEKRRGPRYTPLSKRQDRPAAIYWLVKFHPELADRADCAAGGHRPSRPFASIRDRSHWNIGSITPIDPVALGLCKQTELDAEVQKAAKKKAAEGSLMSDDERRKLVSTESSLAMGTSARLAGIEAISRVVDEEYAAPRDFSNADAFFNLPDADADADEDDEEDSAKKGGKKR